MYDDSLVEICRMDNLNILIINQTLGYLDKFD